MGVSNIRVLVTDVDGTLTFEDLRVCLEAVSVLRLLEGRGVRVILASGNAIIILMALARYFGLSGGVVGENGGVVYVRGDLKVLGRADYALKAKEIIMRKFGSFLIESRQNRFRFVDFAFKVRRDAPISRGRLLSMCRMAVKDLPVEVTDSGVAFHVHERGICKSRGVEILLDYWGVDWSEVLAVGDGLTDIDLLEKAEVGVALAHAPEEVKAVATYVTSRRYAFGFLEAVKRFFNL